MRPEVTKAKARIPCTSHSAMFMTLLRSSSELRSCHGGSSSLSFLGWDALHAVEMALERVEVGGPEAAERSEPLVHLHERLGPQAIQTTLGLDTRLDEAGVTEHAQVLGDRRLRHPQLRLDV